MVQKQKVVQKPWEWKIDLASMVGRYALIETTDGVRREGRISGFKYKDLIIEDRGIDYGDIPVCMPLSIELNGDSADYIEFGRVHRFELR